MKGLLPQTEQQRKPKGSCDANGVTEGAGGKDRTACFCFSGACSSRMAADTYCKDRAQQYLEMKAIKTETSHWLRPPCVLSSVCGGREGSSSPSTIPPVAQLLPDGDDLPHRSLPPPFGTVGPSLIIDFFL